MSVLQIRGGHPYVIREEIPTAGRKYRFPFTSFHMIARNLGANTIKMYFTEADFTADTSYVTIPVAAATAPHGEWKGPAELCDVWLKANTAATILELVIFQRRG